MGVEEELLLVDGSGRPVPLAPAVLGDAAEHGRAAEQRRAAGPTGCLDAELQQEQLETNTAPCLHLAEIDAEVRTWRRRAAEAAARHGAHVAALATSPMPFRPTLSEGPRYRWLAERYGLTALDHLVCGCHVHVSVADLEEAVGVLDRLRVWLPVLLALSANSPYWHGQDSTFASFRSEVWVRWPSSGPNELFGDGAGYRRAVQAMLDTGVIRDERMVYLDARASSRYPTVEIRTADVVLRAEDAVLQAALCRGLVETAAREWAAGELARPVTVTTLRLARWKAGREGLDGELLDPRGFRPRAAGDVVELLLGYVRPALAATGDEATVERLLEDVLRRGTGARRQREVLARTGRLADVVADAVELTGQ